MKVEDFLSRANLANAPELPDNFARGVIVKARAVQRRRQIGSRIAAGVALILLAAFLPWAIRPRAPLANLAQSHAPAHEALASSWQAADRTNALRLAAADNPDAVGDYLMPGTSALRQFASGYSDASWNYDPNWAVDSETSSGG